MDITVLRHFLGVRFLKHTQQISQKKFEDEFTLLLLIQQFPMEEQVNKLC